MLKQREKITTNSCIICPGTRTPVCGDCAVPLHQLAQSLGNAVDAKDSTTYNHSEEVAAASELMSILIGLSEREIETIHLAAHLHDIGKIGIPDSILKKPGRLDQNEQQQIREHCIIGARIVEPILTFNDPCGVSDIILHHHERFDGRGYPDGLGGNDIPLGARIIAIADTLSAMLQDRHYRAGTTFDRASAEIVRCCGSQFDPNLVAVFQRHAALFETVFPLNRPNVINPADIQHCIDARGFASTYMLSHAF